MTLVIGMGHKRFIFLDNWVLSNFTQGERRARLSEFLDRESLTILITSLSMTELYNPNGRPGDRVSRATEFLADHRCAIVDPVAIFRAELQRYPTPLLDLPLELDLAELPAAHRAKALEFLVRRDKVYLRQGKDIAEWAANYEELKSSWLETAEHIIRVAFQEGTLSCDSAGKICDLQSSKEDFLTSLDRRQFGSLSSEERKALGVNIAPLFLGATRELPAIRLTSLCFWYAYVDTDGANRLKRSGSDLGDFLQLSLVPYCTFFTLDKAMNRLMQRVQVDAPTSCVCLSSKDLDDKLGLVN